MKSILDVQKTDECVEHVKEIRNGDVDYSPSAERVLRRTCGSGAKSTLSTTRNVMLSEGRKPINGSCRNGWLVLNAVRHIQQF